MDTTPLTLLQRLQKADDSAAWSHFVELYRPLLFVWARRLGVPTVDAEDLVQEVLLVVLSHVPQFNRRRTGSFRNWLQTLTRNKWFELHRRRRPQLASDCPDLVEPEAPDPAKEFWETEFNDRLLARAVQLMKSDFQEKTWTAVWEVIVGERSPAEVSEALGLTVGAVHAARFRVLARLRQDLDGMLDP